MAANSAVSLTSGVNTVVGSTLALGGGRFAYIAKADSVAGGAPGPNLATVSLSSRYLEQAVFGNATWKFSERLSVTGGLRVAVNRQRTSVDTDGPLVGGKQTLATFESNTFIVNCHTFRYANSAIRAAGTYTGQVTYTLTTP